MLTSTNDGQPQRLGKGLGFVLRVTTVDPECGTFDSDGVWRHLTALVLPTDHNPRTGSQILLHLGAVLWKHLCNVFGLNSRELHRNFSSRLCDLHVDPP
ncbi:hypothetical protein [Ralstonia pseudosolanacearum]|uniref:hypothetical protein n=1 Tax=Ralstonia pseudosolanacearum TaxID=1310165 RepID=UPI003CF6334E